jgi:hypothetical protein
MGFFSFKKTYDNIGVGTKDLGLLQRTTLPAGGSYLGPMWNIKRSMAPVGAPGFMILNGATVPNTLRGSGVYIPGQYALSPLAQPPSNQGS